MLFLQHGIKLQGLFSSEAGGLAGFPHSYLMGGIAFLAWGIFLVFFNHHFGA
jgi:hypothetical protein